MFKLNERCKSESALFFIVLSVVSFLVAIFYTLFSEFGRDWPYFNSLSYFNRSSVMNWGVFPIFDPWHCGGVNALANPQNRLFSPWFLLDLLLPSQFANMASLVLYGALGAWGMFRLSRFFDLSENISIFLAVLFINANWFGLHFAEGHIAFGSFQLLPWIFVCVFQIERKTYSLALGALLAWFLLDGGVYPFVFSFFAIPTAIFLMNPDERRKKFRALAKQIPWLSGVGFASLFLSAPKWVAVLWEHASRVPNLDHVSYSGPLLLKALFFPFNQVGGKNYVLGVHELACYIGLPAVLLIAWQFRRGKIKWRENRKLLVALGFWLFVAGGWLIEINPWNAIFQRLPLFNNAHVQSRTLILFYLLFLLLLGRAVSQLNGARKSTIALLVFLLLESWIVKNYPMYQVAVQGPYKLSGYSTIQSQTVKSTVLGHDNYRGIYHYQRGDLSTKICYDKIFADYPTLHEHEPNYKGEVELENRDGTATILRFTPAELALAHDAKAPFMVVVNTRHSDHWKPIHPGTKVVSRAGERLKLEVSHAVHTTVLQFLPRYLWWLMGAYVLGLTMFLWLARRISATSKAHVNDW